MNIYLQQDGNQTGPFDESTVREGLRQGALTNEVYAWKEGMSDWLPLGELLSVASARPASTIPTFVPPASPVPKKEMPLWGKLLLGCGGLSFVLFIAAVLFFVHLVHVSREYDHNNSSLDKEMAEQNTKSDQAWKDVQAEIERDMADPEHYTTTKINNGDGGTTTTITPKGNVPGGHPITRQVDADGTVTTSWTNADGDAVQRSEDKHHNVRTITTPAKKSGATSSSTANDPDQATAQTNANLKPYSLSGNLEANTREVDQRAAEGGDAEAQTRMGLRYLLGQGGVAKDHKTACDWFRRAAEAGNSTAEAMLGAAYEEGEDFLPRDEKQAAKWYQLAAAQGNPLGQFSLARFYKEGRGGLPRDVNRTVSLFQQATKQGFIAAELPLGECYEEGVGGLPRDLKQAFAHYLKAADQNYPEALYKVGQCHENGTGTDRDLAKARDFYRRAATAGWSDASVALAKLDKTPPSR